MEDIILVGFGGHALSIADSIIRQNKFHIVGYTERNSTSKTKKYKYLGSDEVLEEYYYKGVKNAFICIGYLGEGSIRDKLYEKMKKIGFTFPVIADPSATISDDVRIDEGTFIGKQCIINTGVRIEKQCIINTGVIIEHECNIKEFSHIAVKSVLCGNVSVGDHCFIGANATVIQGIKIYPHSIIGAGSVILDDVQNVKKVYGTWKKSGK